jgi:hypothetical protein
LPDNVGDLSGDQELFLDQSISGLAQDGRINSVRVTLFAEMVKGKLWAPATLHDVGGAEGIGLAFLEETFSASTAPPEHRLHQKNAQAVLKALLPETGTDIKGQMRSEGELQEAATHTDRPREFADLIHILDNELRLITPTDPEGSGEKRQHGEAGGRYYQLTHDYLVHSLRDWLTRKQKQTRRGRADLLLEERYSIWRIKEENRHFPSFPEWLMIAIYSNKKKWSSGHFRMLYCSFLYFFLSGLLNLLVFFLVIGILLLAFMASRDTATGREFAKIIIVLVILASLGMAVRRSNSKRIADHFGQDEEMLRTTK